MSMEDSFKIHENTEEKELRGLLLRHKNFVEMQIFEVYLEMHKLNEEEESIHRIWRCFQALEEKEKNVLRQITFFTILVSTGHKVPSTSSFKYAFHNREFVAKI